MSSEEQVFIDWANKFFETHESSTRFTNLSTDVRSGVKVKELLESLTQSAVLGLNSAPTLMLHLTANATVILRAISQLTMDSQSLIGCSVVSANMR